MSRDQQYFRSLGLIKYTTTIDNSSHRIEWNVYFPFDEYKKYVSFSVNMDVKMKQTFILKLLNHVTEPVMYKEISDIGRTFDIESNMHFYTVSRN